MVLTEEPALTLPRSVPGSPLSFRNPADRSLFGMQKLLNAMKDMDAKRLPHLLKPPACTHRSQAECFTNRS